MNLPNKLTLSRIIMIPFFVVFLLLSAKEGFENQRGLFIALAEIVFIVASFTDFLDGYLARKNHLVTNFGKFADPIADKLLVCSAFICFIEINYMSAWMVCIIIGRELIISGFRLVAVEQGVVIAAGIWGKFKTAFSMIYIIVAMANFPISNTYAQVYKWSSNILMWVCFILTIVSMVEYLYKNKDVILSGDI